MLRDKPELAREVKQELTKQYPTCKWSTRIERYQFSGGWAEERKNNGITLTQEAWDCMAAAFKIANKDNWDKSDIQTDYFNVNYYLHLAIGKWDKPFTETQPH